MIKADTKFIVACLNCAAKAQKGEVIKHGGVEHNYTAFPWGIRIKFKCWTCGEKEVKDVMQGESPKVKSKEEFMKRIGNEKVLH